MREKFSSDPIWNSMQLACFHDTFGSLFFNLAGISFVIIYFILIALPFCSVKSICLLSIMC